MSDKGREIIDSFNFLFRVFNNTSMTKTGRFCSNIAQMLGLTINKICDKKKIELHKSFMLQDINRLFLLYA